MDNERQEIIRGVIHHVNEEPNFDSFDGEKAHPPVPLGHIDTGSLYKGGSDYDLDNDTEASLVNGNLPIKALDENIRDLDRATVNNIIQKAFIKLGVHTKPQYEGEGTMGYSFTDGTKSYKITTDVSEAAECQKMAGKTNKYLADVYEVHQVQMNGLKTKVFLIVMERLKVDYDTFGAYQEDLDEIFGKTCNSEFYNILELFRDYRDQYDHLYKTKIKPVLDQYPEQNKFWHQLLLIVTELKQNGIGSLDLTYSNLGYKNNGKLGFFDYGYSGDNSTRGVDTLALENMIYERITSYMKGSQAMTVKKKCQLGGNGDGTSTACNQGDINNVELKTISENVQLLDKNLLKTGKISEEDKQNILSITNGDNYTYLIGMLYQLFCRDADQAKKNEWFKTGVGQELRETYNDVKSFDPNVFPIAGYDPYLKSIHPIELVEALRVRRFAIKVIKTIPEVYLRNVRADIRTPRTPDQFKYPLEKTIKDLNDGLKMIARLSPEKKDMYMKKFFSSQHTTLESAAKGLENVEILFLSQEDSVEEIISKIGQAAYDGDAKLLYDKNNVVVADILSSDGMKFLGCGSTWCFHTESGNQYWSDYAGDDHVNIVWNFNVEPDAKDRMFVVLPTGEVYNMYNEYVDDGFDKLQQLGVGKVVNAYKRVRPARKTQKAFNENNNFVSLSEILRKELKKMLTEAKIVGINDLPFKNDIEKAGGKIYSVGGAVRDTLIGKESKDLDLLVTGLPFERLDNLLMKYGRVDTVGKSFGVIKFNSPETGELDIAIPRTERPTGQGGYQGFEVTSDHSLPIEKDLERRDFTINAIAKDSTGKKIDPYGGEQDIKNRVIRMVNPQAFSDDPLRMLRAVQFAARFGFTIEPKTFEAIKQNASKIKEISPERILIEFDKIVKKGNPAIGAQRLADTGLYENIFGVEPKFNVHEFHGVKTMGEFIYQLTKYSIANPAEFYKTNLKGDLDTYNEIKAYDLAFKDTSNNPVQNKLTVFAMYKTFPASVDSLILPDNIKNAIKEMKGLGMPFSFKELQINGNELLAMGYSGQQIGKILKDLLVDVYSGKVRNNNQLLLRQVIPVDQNPTKNK
jgi:tRNA nucleotidyltransferase/poly(A) polymerase